MAKKGFTGYQRQRTTRRSVRLAERVARTLISIGGIGTIVAVSAVFIFLSWVVVPLFTPEKVTVSGRIPVVADDSEMMPVHLATDEYQLMGWVALDGGARIRSFRLDTGENLGDLPLFADEAPTAFTFTQQEGQFIAGFADGTLRLGQVSFSTDYLAESLEDAVLRDLPAGGRASYDGGMVERTAEGQLRLQTLRVEVQEPTEALAAAPVLLADVSQRPSGPVLCAITGDGVFHISSISTRRNLLTGETTVTLDGGSLAVPHLERGIPSHLLLSGIADSAFLVWDDGDVVRIDTRDLATPEVTEETDILPEPGLRLTRLNFLIGKTTLIAGDSEGGIRAWFRVKPQNASTGDGSVLISAHEFAGSGAAVTALAPSFRSRVLGVGYADGTVRLFHVTSNQMLTELQVGDASVGALAISPKDDRLAAIVGSELIDLDIDAPHPETTIASMFGKVHYEGMEAAEHIWQSSSGTDDFEPKYGLIPLIFGTLKATFYSLLFGVPLAILAAIYTSEFLHGKVKARIKPLVEMMASLPSVVLGFLAALIIAPFVENVVPGIIAAFFTIPLTLLLGAYLFQLLPQRITIILRPWRFPLICLVALPVGVLLAASLGPPLERLLFSGNLRLWLNGQVGDGTAGWLLMLLPLSGIAVGLFVSKVITPRMRNFLMGLERGPMGLFELGKFLVLLVATGVLAWLLAEGINAAGYDSRGSFPLIGPALGTYVQRNALVVGFVMGFAIIPIIYTLAEDALAAVPDHLRSASLAAGATPWQTAVRVVLPTAMSGLFSACMIGLGRAVGETMIVLMAAGNTPVLEWNVFNGFRTLSANIAVELPEAVIYSTHFRTLFLAALTLFLMTFVVNTLAEIVRLRFRKRAYQL